MMKNKSIILIAAIIVELFAFPFLLIEGKFWPNQSCIMIIDAWERIGLAGQLYHDLKNLMTELYRCDPQWWSKFSLSLIVILIFSNLICAAWIIKLKRIRE